MESLCRSAVEHKDRHGGYSHAVAKDGDSRVERIDWFVTVLLGVWSLYKTLQNGKKRGYI
jgi:hypothetical protein